MTTEDWKKRPLSELAAHIVNTHHAFCRNEMTRLKTLFNESLAPAAQAPASVRSLQDDFQRMCKALAQHLDKEEMQLFPLISRLETAEREHTPPPESTFGSVANPIRMMVLEHAEAETILADMRKRTDGFALPQGASPSVQKLFEALRAFDEDMKTHVELEDVVLFPRAISLEQRLIDSHR